ncbi:MAG: NAD(P)H-hydrate epimerase [Alcanivorax sp.]
MTYEILSNAQMAAADAKTIAGGTAGIDLMTTAGNAVAECIDEYYEIQNVLVLCGPGNNGGDGFIIAQCLKTRGWPVTLACLTKQDALKGDAALAAQRWEGETLPFDQVTVEDHLIIDAVFGTGFSRALPDDVINVFKQIEGNEIIAVDIPSGINGNTGAADPNALRADITVTFHRKKLGHVLYPGAQYCGHIITKDIGITDDFEYSAIENTPDLWIKDFPLKKADTHKYHYGHALIYGAPELTGATRLAATACARIGTGLVSVLSTPETATIYRSALPACILVRDDLDYMDKKITARLYGSGGLPCTVDYSIDLPTVLDADALSHLPEKLTPNYVLTPHEGEFERAFPDIDGSKIERAQKAAKQINAHIALKGPDTIIAAPDGKTIINTNGSPHLATAGTGDALAGMICGLMAQNMPPLIATGAAIWIHAESANLFGAGLIADDLLEIIPDILNRITQINTYNAQS